MANKSKKIVRGPSKFDLMIALFHWDGGQVEFVLGDRSKQSMYITSVERVDGPNDMAEKWNFTGTAGDASFDDPKFRGHYSTKTRTGILIRVEDKME